MAHNLVQLTTAVVQSRADSGGEAQAAAGQSHTTPTEQPAPATHEHQPPTHSQHFTPEL